MQHLFSPRALALCALFPAAFWSPRLATAQPEGGQRGMMPIPDKPPLSLKEMEKLTGGPTLLTYSGQNVPLADIVEFFRKTAGQAPTQYRLQLPKDAPVTISVDWMNVPFWTAAAEVEKLTGLRWSQNLWSGLSLSAPDASQGSGLGGIVVAETPYLKIYGGTVWHTTVTNASLSSQEAAPPPADVTRINLTVYLDPKIKLTGGALKVMDLKLAGKDTAPPVVVTPVRVDLQSLIASGLSGGSGSGLVVPLTLELPAGLKSGTDIPKLSATMRMAANLVAKVWNVDDLLNSADAQEELNGSQFIVGDAKIENKRLRLSLEIDGDAAAPTGPNGIFNPNGLVDVVAGMRQVFAAGAEAPAALNPPAPGAAGIGAPGNFGGAALVPGVVNAIPLGARMGNPFRMGGRGGAFNGVTVRDSKGNVLQNVGMRTMPANAIADRPQAKVELDFNLGDAVGPFQMEWNLPTPTRNIDTPLELKDLQVP